MYKTVLKQNINNLFNVKVNIYENKEKWNPLINNYFFSFRHGVYSFNLNQSLRLLKKLIYLFKKIIQCLYKISFFFSVSLEYNFDWDLFFIYLNNFASFLITNEKYIAWFLSVLSYIYFCYFCYKQYKLTWSFYSYYSDGFTDKISLKKHKLLLKIHYFGLATQSKLNKILVLFFLLFKIKVLIKLFFFKHMGSFYCLAFLYGQAIFIQQILMSYFSLLSNLKDKSSADDMLIALGFNYNLYRKISIILIVLVIIDLFSLILKYI